MSRRLSWIATLTAALVFAGTAPAAAVGPFGPAEVVIGGCTQGVGDAAIAVDGTTRGFANCTGFSSGRIWFFRDHPSTAPSRESSPYTGVVYAVAWDGLDSTYVVFQQGTQLKIGKRIESSGTYAPLTTLATAPAGSGYRFRADVVAASGRWWAVWSELTAVEGGGEPSQTQLFQRHTLLGVQGRTRITNTARNVSDTDPTLAYAGGRLTLVWMRFSPGTDRSSVLRIAHSTGGAWSSRPLVSLLGFDHDPDVTVYAGVTWVTWGLFGGIAVGNNSTGAFSHHTFATPGGDPTVAVSGSHAFVAGWAFESDHAFIAELSGGAWTEGHVDDPPSYPLRVLAQGTKARVIYRVPGDALYIRTQT